MGYHFHRVMASFALICHFSSSSLFTIRQKHFTPYDSLRDHFTICRVVISLPPPSHQHSTAPTPQTGPSTVGRRRASGRFDKEGSAGRTAVSRSTRPGCESPSRNVCPPSREEISRTSAPSFKWSTLYNLQNRPPALPVLRVCSACPPWLLRRRMNLWSNERDFPATVPYVRQRDDRRQAGEANLGPQPMLARHPLFGDGPAIPESGRPERVGGRRILAHRGPHELAWCDPSVVVRCPPTALLLPAESQPVGSPRHRIRPAVRERSFLDLGPRHHDELRLPPLGTSRRLLRWQARV